MRLFILCGLSAAVLAGCTNVGSYSKALGTPKNPLPTFGSAPANGFWLTNYKILSSVAFDAKTNQVQCILSEDDMATTGQMCPTEKQYVEAGFALSDFYCDNFFRWADESQRRRKFARGIVSDAGTAIATIMGLANAGENVVAGAAAGFGLIDKSFRNYDESFVVAPDLSIVQSLVLTAQDNFREATLGSSGHVPASYATAQTVVLRYANMCSTLGMKALLNRAAAERQSAIAEDTKTKREEGSDGGSDGQAGGAARPPDGAAVGQDGEKRTKAVTPAAEPATPARDRGAETQSYITPG